MGQSTRTCLDCPMDISHRHWRAVRCERCANIRYQKQGAAKRTRTCYEHTCEWCAKLFISRAKHQRFCCTKCCGLASHPGNVVKKCVVCRTRFMISRQFERDTCSRSCTKWHAKHPRELPATNCLFCDNVLVNKHKDARYCSRRCSVSHRNRIIGKTSRPIIVTYVCLKCGRSLEGRALNTQYCSRACQAREQQERRSRKKSVAPVEIIYPGDIFRRDSWVCHLCHEVVDPLLGSQHPLMASVDHIIPVKDSNYPGHVWENLATAHLQCNIRKSNKVTLGDWSLYYRLRLERYGHLDELDRELVSHSPG